MRAQLLHIPTNGLVIATLLLAQGPARAESPNDKAAAETLFEQGKLLLSKREVAEACRKFEASEALDAGIGTLLYLGECYEKLGRTASAWAAFREASSLASAAGQERRQTVATARARALEPVLVRLAIEVAPENTRLAGFELRRDGALVPQAGYGVPIPVDPGEHRIVAAAPDKQPYAQVVTVTQGSRQVSVPILVAARPSSSAEPVRAAHPGTPSPHAAPVVASGPRAPAGAESRPSSPGVQRGIAYALGVAGLVGLGVGSYFGLRALDRNSKSKDECRANDASLCTVEGLRLREDAQTAATYSTIGFGAGGALLAAGVVLWFTVPARPAGGLAGDGGLPVLPTGAQVSLRGRW